MNASYDTSNKEHVNLIAKMRNTLVDLNWYAHKFMCYYSLGSYSTPKTGVESAIKMQVVSKDMKAIINQRDKIINSNPESANKLFHETWKFLHDFDKKLKDVSV